MLPSPRGYERDQEVLLVSAEKNKALFRRAYAELWNRGNLSVADELIAPDFMNHAATPGSDRGPDSMRASVTWARNAFPDLHFKVEELVAGEDIVAGRLTMSGTHRGPLMGLPATGRSVRTQHMHFVRFRDGQAVEHWGARDDLGMMRQLGFVVIPGPRLLGRLLMHQARKFRARSPRTLNPEVSGPGVLRRPRTSGGSLFASNRKTRSWWTNGRSTGGPSTSSRLPIDE